MPDYSQYGVPRPVEVGRQVQIDQKRPVNRAALFAIAGVLVLCVCVVVAGAAAVYFLNASQSGSRSSGFNLPFSSNATATPPDSGKPTAVPFLRGVKDAAGMRLTVTSYQRPLPAQGITIPKGQELALVSVRLENTRTTGGPIKYSTADFALVSAEGDNFAPDSGGITTGAMLKEGEVEPGKTAVGDIVFYVYSDVKDLNLEWTSADGTSRLFKVTR